MKVNAPLSPSRRDLSLLRRLRPTSRRRSGQTLVETAVVLTFVLLPVTMGILQFGIVLNANNTLQQLAREGGRYAAVRHTDAEIKDYIRQVAAGTSINPADLPDSAITVGMVPSTATRTSGNPINVVITYPMSKKIFVGDMIAGVVRLKQNYTVESTFVLE